MAHTRSVAMFFAFKIHDCSTERISTIAIFYRFCFLLFFCVYQNDTLNNCTTHMCENIIFVTFYRIFVCKIGNFRVGNCCQHSEGFHANNMSSQNRIDIRCIRYGIFSMILHIFNRGHSQPIDQIRLDNGIATHWNASGAQAMHCSTRPCYLQEKLNGFMTPNQINVE